MEHESNEQNEWRAEQKNALLGEMLLTNQKTEYRKQEHNNKNEQKHDDDEQKHGKILYANTKGTKSISAHQRLQLCLRAIVTE